MDLQFVLGGGATQQAQSQSQLQRQPNKPPLYCKYIVAPYFGFVEGRTLAIGMERLKVVENIPDLVQWV